MKASAGSGKTFNLAKKYITLLFNKDDLYAYKHILAVTFTNMATTEMKGRILKELYVLAYSTESSPYLEYLTSEEFLNANERLSISDISKRAKSILIHILHDYGAFSISTIDKFFQQTLKAFSREIGQFASYQIELDRNSLIEETVDRILDSLSDEKKELLSWLKDSIIEQIENGGKYSLEMSLLDLATRLKSESHRSQVEKYNLNVEEIYSHKTLNILKDECKRIIISFTEKVKSGANDVINVFINSGVDLELASKSFAALYQYVEVNIWDEIEAPTPAFIRNALDDELWFSKANAKKYKHLVEPALGPIFERFIKHFEEPYKAYMTARILSKQVLGLGIASEINKEFETLLKEKNVLSLDDSNTILKNIIDGTDTPFIYEKMGVRYENFLLDEFQDTAQIQWDNFLPLLKNSEAQGFDNLIVGDVKQSIYRWRGSQWKLLDGDIYKDFPSSMESTLVTNYRSLENIIHFNNEFFTLSASLLDEQLDSTAERKLKDIYSDVKQGVGRLNKDKGQVDIRFCNKDSEEEKVIEKVNELVENGVSYSDIAVIIRFNKEAGKVANALIEAGIPVITDDSLKVKNSEVVRKLVALLSYADNPNDKVASFLAASLKVELKSDFPSLLDICEYFLRAIKRDNADKPDFGNQSQYIFSFLDYLKDYIKSNGNNLNGFLKYWEDKNPSISSDSESDSVRIITIHKSKGLDFQYVIFPYLDRVDLFDTDNAWVYIDFKNTEFNPSATDSVQPTSKGLDKGLYDILLSSKSLNTYFAEDYKRELRLQYVDNLNVVYVAMTRAVKSMCLISAFPSKSFIQGLEKGSPTYKHFSDLLYYFSENNNLGIIKVGSSLEHINYSLGTLPSHNSNKETEKNNRETLTADYISYPLNSDSKESTEDEDLGNIPVGERGRLKISVDAADFFLDEDPSVTSPVDKDSKRMRGIILHEILSRVEVEEDLKSSVDLALTQGQIDKEESETIYDYLFDRIQEHKSSGWFPKDRDLVQNERDIIDADGDFYRPDRVVHTPEGVIIIDYKFGKEKASYIKQITKYIEIYQNMNLPVVSAYLWYVDSNLIQSYSPAK